MFNIFFLENRTVYEIMLKNTVEPEGPQMMSQYGAYVLHAGSAGYMRSRAHAHTHTTITHTPTETNM